MQSVLIGFLTLVSVWSMVLPDGLDLLQDLTDHLAMEKAIRTLVTSDNASNTCTSRDGPTCIYMGIGPPELAKVKNYIESSSWQIKLLKEKLSEDEIVQALLDWWKEGETGFLAALKSFGLNKSEYSP